MAQAAPYESKIATPVADRFTITASGSPALFVEFFNPDYHIYGPQRGTPSTIIETVKAITQALGGTDLATYRILTAKEMIAAEMPEPLTVLEKLGNRSDVQYMDVTFSRGHVWADVNAGMYPRFGFATPFHVADHPLTYLRNLTTVTLSDTDLNDIANFLKPRTSNRYRHV
jgi:hypothetical protein